MLESYLFVSKGDGAELVDCRILSTFSSKKEANSSAECPESTLVRLSPVRIPSDFQGWRGLDCSYSMRSLQYFDFVVLKNWWDSHCEVSQACRLPSVRTLPLVLCRRSSHRVFFLACLHSSLNQTFVWRTCTDCRWTMLYTLTNGLTRGVPYRIIKQRSSLCADDCMEHSFLLPAWQPCFRRIPSCTTISNVYGLHGRHCLLIL